MTSNMAFSICSFFYIILTAIAYFKKQRVKNEETNIYTILITVTIVGILIEIMTAILNINIIGFEELKTLFLKLIIVFFFTWIYVFTAYIFVISTKAKLSNKHYNIAGILYILFIILILLLPIYKEIDNNIVLYTYGPSINLLYISFLFMTVLTIILLIKNYKNLGSKKYIPIYVYFLIGFVVVLIQTLNPSLLLLASLDAFITVLMFHTIENPDIRMLEELAKVQKLSESTNNEKSNFLYNITNAITSGLDKVEKIANNTIDATQKDEAVKNMNELKILVNKSRTMIKQTIDISGMDNVVLQLRNNKYNIKNILESIYYLKRKDVSEKIDFRLNISDNLPNELYGDSIKVKQIILSVVDNAIKYTKKGFVEIRVNSIIKNDVCRLIIIIEDSGIGMNVYKQSELMNNHSSLTKEELELINGKTLNLKIVKKMISAIGGSFNIGENEFDGTTVSITIDQQISESEKSLEEKQLEKYSSLKENKKKIAVVSKNQSFIKNIRTIANKKGYQLLEYNMTKQLLDLVRNEEVYDVIFIDKDMEKINAINFLEKVKQLDSFSSKVVVLTDYTDEERNYLLAIGFNKVIHNNVTKKEIEDYLK